MSCTSNSRTLKVGESIAHCRAQPRDTDSDALRVRPPSLPNTEVMVVSTAGTREAEPTSSTEWMSSLERPESSRALARGFSTRSSTGLASSRNWSRSIWKETSLSSIRDSTLRGAEVLALRIFLSLSQAVRRRRDALWLLRTSILYFSLHASAKWSNSACGAPGGEGPVGRPSGSRGVLLAARPAATRGGGSRGAPRRSRGRQRSRPTRGRGRGARPS
mmetsp:Transcript_57813/g.183327  ORF Transcript_57813/g.183327 Transcript_57813/m.183327 type:complete len:218 (+) Transcript_57813:1232-1885(+)